MPVYKARGYFNDPSLVGDQDYSWNFHVTVSGTSDDAWDLVAAHAANFLDVLCPATIELVKVNIENKDVVNGLQTRNVGTHGTRAVTGSALPGWNVARFQSTATDGGRVHTWFLKMGLTEDDVDGQLLEGAVTGAISNFLTALDALGGFCDKDGQVFVNHVQDDYVHMRQMGWHRRTREGFHRGWVPNP